MDKHMHMCVCRVAFLTYLFFSSSYLNFYNAEGGRGGCFPKFFLMPNKLKASKKYSINPSLSVSHAEGTPVIFWVNALVALDTDHYSPLFLESPASVIHSFTFITYKIIYYLPNYPYKELGITKFKIIKEFSHCR